MTRYQVVRLSANELGRLAELRSRLRREDASGPAWSGDRLYSRYQAKLAGEEMAVWVARSDSHPGAADGGEGQDVGYAWFQVSRRESSLKEVGYLP